MFFLPFPFGGLSGDGPTPPPPYLPPDADALAFLDGTTAPLLHMLRISLFSDARASDDDPLPVAGYKGGWWADTYDGAYPVGSKLWLLDRAVVTQDAINRAQNYAEIALQWLVRYGIAASVAVTAERIASDNSAAGIGLVVTVTKPDTSRETFRFADIWAELGGASG